MSVLSYKLIAVELIGKTNCVALNLQSVNTIPPPFFFLQALNTLPARGENWGDIGRLGVDDKGCGCDVQIVQERR